MKDQQTKKNWKQRFIEEFTEYFFNFIYMAIIFSAIILYRRLVLAEYGIVRPDYFFGVIKAFVIAKVVMIAAFLSISRKFENKPLTIPVLYKALLFTLIVMVFDIIEIYVKALFQNPDLMEAFEVLKTHIDFIWLGAAMLIFFIFIPFFAFKELIRVMGKEEIQKLFLKGSEK